MSMVHSNTTGKDYEVSKAVRLINPKQVSLYMINDAELLDIYPSTDFQTGEPLLVYIFDREKTKSLYDAFCKYELKVKRGYKDLFKRIPKEGDK